MRRKLKLPKSATVPRSEEHTSELQSRLHLVCRLLLEKKSKVAEVDRDKLATALVPQNITHVRDARGARRARNRGGPPGPLGRLLGGVALLLARGMELLNRLFAHLLPHPG